MIHDPDIPGVPGANATNEHGDDEVNIPGVPDDDAELPGVDTGDDDEDQALPDIFEADDDDQAPADLPEPEVPTNEPTIIQPEPQLIQQQPLNAAVPIEAEVLQPDAPR